VPDTEEHLERELKFDVAADWLLPDLARLTPPGGSVQHETAHLETTYFDTAARHLLGSRLTLRLRAGDTDAGWQLKVPAGDARTEIRLPATGRVVPAELREATRGVRAGATLTPLATLTTAREIHRLLDESGSPQAEIVVDEVTAMSVREVGVTRHWREVEVELVEGDERLLSKAARWLTKQGAVRSSSSSKLAHAVDADTGKPRDTTTLSGLVEAYLDAQADAIVRGDIDLRLGHAAVHATRVGTRRYRSVLRVLGGIFEPGRAEALDAELAWFAGALGEVRDLQVLQAHLADSLAELTPELVVGPVAQRIHEAIAAEEQAASTRLAALMRTRRYFALLALLRAWRAELPVATDGPAEDIAGYLAKAERSVRRRLKAVPTGTGRDEALHDARKAAKRARYIAELSTPELGKTARLTANRMKATQERLGLRQDRIVAAGFLRRVAPAAAASGQDTFTYGLLYERELSRAAAVTG
jgi:CHAD domain-containing protein